MTDTLWSGQTPALTNQSDGSPGIATCTTITISQARSCVGIQFRATDTKGGTYTAELWQVTSADASSPAGTLLASKAVVASAITAGAYNEITFDSPVSLSAGVLYRCALHNSDGRYVATNGFFTSSGLTNGDITAYQSGTDPNPPLLGVMRQGVFRIAASAGTYPTTPSGANASYFVGPVLAGNEPSAVTLTPAVLTLTAVPLTATPGVVTVALTAAELVLTAVPLTATPQPVTVALTPAVFTLTAVPFFARNSQTGTLTASASGVTHATTSAGTALTAYTIPST